MKTLRQLVRDESGMTLPLAMIMIVLLGVMGAGLLTFVMRDLNTVVEENRGQRAFEVADAGIGAAKQQLAANVDRTAYDGDGLPMEVPEPNCGSEASGESQWSALRCEDPAGLTLTNLDDDGTTPDSVTVTIEYMGEDTDEFRVISEGTYGDPLPQPAKRRIEAIFHGLEAGAGGEGENVGHPLYYTPSSISVDGPNVQMNAISVFAGQDLLIESVANTANVATNMASFKSEYEDSGGTFQGFGGKKDSLCDWNSLNPLKGPSSPTQGCYVTSAGPYNDIGRTITTGPAKNPKIGPFVQPGFAAEGLICGFPNNSVPPGTCGGTAASAADGVYGYDSTTEDRGNHLEFVSKDCTSGTCPANLPNQLSTPSRFSSRFPRGSRKPHARLLVQRQRARKRHLRSATLKATRISQTLPGVLIQTTQATTE